MTRDASGRGWSRSWLLVFPIAGALTFTSMAAPADYVLTFVLLAAAAIGVVWVSVWWAWGAVSEWRALVDPNPTPPDLVPRYWPGSKADLAQKAAPRVGDSS